RDDGLYAHGVSADAVGSPQLYAGADIIRQEEECSIDVSEESGIRAKVTGTYIRNPRGSVRRAVAAPEFVVVSLVCRTKKKSAIKVRYRGARRLLTWIRACAAGRNVLDHESPGCRAVALPQLRPVSPVIGSEEQRPVHVGRLKWVRAAAAGVDVLHED